MPPSLSVSVGVPPATVTASLRLTVSVTTLAGVEVAAPPVMPVPEAATDATVGAVVSICRVPAGLVTAPGRLAALPAPSLTVAPLRLTAVTVRSDGVLAGRHRVAEGQRVGAGAAGIGRGAAIVERQRRRAAALTVTASLRLTVSVTTLPALKVAGAGGDAGAGRHHRGHRRRRGVDLQRAGRIGHRPGQVGGIAGAVLDGRAVRD